MSRVNEITMYVCDNCGATDDQPGNLCWRCGLPMVRARFIRASDEYTTPAPELTPAPVDLDMFEACLRWLSTAP